jgi:hypothetical protein
MEEKINELHEKIKEMFPDAVYVKIEVNPDGIKVEPLFKTNLKNCSMRTITGKWITRCTYI